MSKCAEQNFSYKQTQTNKQTNTPTHTNTHMHTHTHTRTHLVGAADEIEVVAVQEALHNLRAKGKADSAVILAPRGRVLVRVRPQQVTDQA